eukprot:TRINITY_DN104889_c0_g1_i1.p1 TRINITY_DN104889_c0_g1~~TRINITY_DN104889_c0_g1_i1.p1  ORF type:complete len:517 (+),score=85.67 TRINITY_DN104889_c0_g1_i1:192-1553(+)
MAMRLRHRVHGCEFRRSVAEEPAQPPASELRPASPSSAAESVTIVLGPNNILGLQVIFMHPLCIFLLCSPLGIASHFLNWGDAWTFWLNFFALVPLAKILGDATEELAASLHNDTVTGLLNATFGNAVEMIVSVQSIRGNLLSIVKASLLGSVLSNTLLVLGTAFLLGGLTSSSKKYGPFHSFNVGDFQRHATHFEKEQKFAIKGAMVSMAMLLFSCMSFALPTIFDSYPSDDSKSVLKVSRIGAIIVFCSYIAYLVFQLLTHGRTLACEEDDLIASPGGQEDGDEEEQEDEDESGAGLTMSCAILLMLIVTVVVAINSEYLVNTIEAIVVKQGIPASFIGVVLLPIAGNACEHASAIRFAMMDRPGLAIGIAVGSATQISLLVVPFSVLVAWALDKPLDLNFGCLNAAVVTFCILVVMTLLLDGRSNWFKGYLLCSMYAFLSVLYWYTPQDM